MRNKEKKRERIYCVLVFYIVFCYPFLCNFYNINSRLEIINRILLLLLFAIFIFIRQEYYRLKLTKEKAIVLLPLIYLSLSLGLCTYIYSYSISFFIREFFYSILPLVLYVFISKVSIREKRAVLNIIVFATLISVFGGLLLYLKIDLFPFVSYLGDENSSFKLNSIYGSIMCGYLEQLSFAIILFKKKKKIIHYVLLVAFAGAVLLTAQRMGFAGMLIAILVYVMFNKQRNGKTSYYNNFFFILSIGIIGAVCILILNQLELFRFDIFERFYQTLFHRFSGNIFASREEQQIITEKNAITFLFGEGFGKYSHNNEFAVLVQSDACYYRMLNELGIVGTIIFLFPIFRGLAKEIKRRDAFFIYFFLEILVAFYFNRIVWTIPMNYVLFIILAFRNTSNYLKTEEIY